MWTKKANSACEKEKKRGKTARKDRALLRRTEKAYQRILKALSRKPSPLVPNTANPDQTVLVGDKIGFPDLILLFDSNSSQTFKAKSTENDEVIVVGLKGLGWRFTDVDTSPRSALEGVKKHKNVLIHELVHYVDTRRIGEEAWSAGLGSYKSPEENPSVYFNHPFELNAYFLQALSEMTERIEKTLSYINPRKNDNSHQVAVWELDDWMIENKDFKRFRRSFWSKFHNQAKRHLTPKNKRRQDKRLYDTWSKLYRKAQRTMDYLLKSGDEAAQMMKTASSNRVTSRFKKKRGKTARNRAFGASRRASGIEAPPAMFKSITRWVWSLMATEALRQVETLRERRKDPLRWQQEVDFLGEDAAWDSVVDLGEIERLAKRYGGKKPTRPLPKNYKRDFPLDLSGWKHEKTVQDLVGDREGYSSPLWMLNPVTVIWVTSPSHAPSRVRRPDGRVPKGTWDTGLLRLFMSPPRGTVTPKHFKRSMEEVARVIRHELQHLSQAVLRNATGNPLAGFPAGGRGGDDDKEHALRDVEFYTRLQDDIDEFFRLRGRFGPGGDAQATRQAVKVWIGQAPSQPVGMWKLRTSEFFAALKRHDRGKYRKAVKEFWKAVSQGGTPSYRTKVGGTPDTWSKLYRKAQRTMDYLLKSGDEMAQMMKTASSNPLKTLKSYLKELNRLVEREDYDALVEIMESDKEKRKLSKMIGDADEFLTDKRRPSDYGGGYDYAGDAEDVLTGDTAIVHLTDGGYSRLSLRMIEAPFIWIDKGISTTKVVDRWVKSKVATQRVSSTFKQTKDGRLIGYKVMNYDPTTGNAISGANSRIQVPIRKGAVHRMPGQGIFVSAEPQHVLDYYAVHDVNVLITYSFDPDDIAWGRSQMNDREAEIGVSRTIVEDFEVFEDEDF